MMAAPEPMAIGANRAELQEAQLPDYSFETLALGPVDDEIFRIVNGFEYPELEVGLVEVSLMALGLSSAKYQVKPFYLICACRAGRERGPFRYLEHRLLRHVAGKSAAPAANVAPAVAPLSDLVDYGDAKHRALDVVAALKDWQ